MRAFRKQLLVALEVHLRCGWLFQIFSGAATDHQRGDHRQCKPPVPLGIYREEPLRFGRFDERNAPQFQGDARCQRAPFPKDNSAFRSSLTVAFEYSEGEGAEIPEVFLVWESPGGSIRRATRRGGRGHR